MGSGAHAQVPTYACALNFVTPIIILTIAYGMKIASTDVHIILIMASKLIMDSAPSPLELCYGSVEIYIDEILGTRSYGKVCKAKCGQLPCVAKLLYDSMFQWSNPDFIKQFQQECKLLSSIKHPNIVQYLGTISNPESGRPVLLMEMMDESLTKFLERSMGPLLYHTQVNICHDVALALAYLHFNAIIHRDLSGNNVLLIGSGSRAKVSDFGMSKMVSMNPQITPLAQYPGTSVYMPPEALTIPPRYSSKVDCFSHGVLTIQIVTRNFPNPGDANMYVEDPKYPTGRVLVQYPEKDRRRKDIDLIKSDHPLLPIALNCINDWEGERPSADEVCERLSLLKKEARYAKSEHQANDQTSIAQTSIIQPSIVQKLQSELISKGHEIRSKEEALRRITEKHRKELEEKEQANQRLTNELETLRKKLQIDDSPQEDEPNLKPCINELSVAVSI